MGWVKKLMEKLVRLQFEMMDDEDKLRDAISKGSGNVCVLRVKGTGGEIIKMKAEEGKIMFADDGERHVHMISMSEDTFIDILTGEMTLRYAYSSGYVTFRGEDWLVHASRWAQAFDEMGHLTERLVGWGPQSE